jgi:hypothetical protein
MTGVAAMAVSTSRAGKMIVIFICSLRDETERVENRPPQLEAKAEPSRRQGRE